MENVPYHKTPHFKDRQELLEIIYLEGTFTAKELIHRFQQRHGRRPEIDPVESVKDFLDYLSENNLLSVKGNKYYVPQKR